MITLFSFLLLIITLSESVVSPSLDDGDFISPCVFFFFGGGGGV